MELLSIGKIIDFVGQLIVGERIKKITNPIFEKYKETFIIRLSNIIHQTIEKCDNENKIQDTENQYGFYKSQKIIDLLLKFKYFENHNINSNFISQELNKDNRIIKTNLNEINIFLNIFNSKILQDSKLQELEISERYQQKIYDIYQKLDSIVDLLNQQNKINVDGNGNYIFQDVNNSNIEIKIENLSELKNIISKTETTESNTLKIIELLDSIENKQFENYNSILENLKQIIEYLIEIYKNGINNILNIIILSTSADKLNNSYSTNYGTHSKEWKPFDDQKNIEELLNEYSIKAGFEINKLYFEDLNLFSEADRENIINEILGEKENFILIIDSNILMFEDYKKITDLFNNSAIGGCIIPIYENKISEEMLSKIKTKLNQLYTHFFVNLHKEFMQIELFVQSKDILFRRLSNIAILKLRRESSKKSKLNREIKSELGHSISKL